MTDLNRIKANIDGAKAFIEAAERAMDSDGDTVSILDAASTCISQCRDACDELLADIGKRPELANIDFEVRPAPTIADLERINKERGLRDRSKTAAGKTVN